MGSTSVGDIVRVVDEGKSKARVERERREAQWREYEQRQERERRERRDRKAGHSLTNSLRPYPLGEDHCADVEESAPWRCLLAARELDGSR